MTEEILNQQIASSLQRLETLWQRANALPRTAKPFGQDDIDPMGNQPEDILLQESLEELNNSLAELQAVSEELRQQNDELVMSRFAIEAERQRYRELFELAPDAYLVTNLQGRIKTANQAAEKLFNLRRDRLVGKPLIVFIPGLIRPEYRTQLNQLQSGQEVRNWELPIQPRCQVVKKLEMKGQSVNSTEWEGEIPFDGLSVCDRPSVNLTETDCTVVLILDEQNQGVELRWLLRDITQRKQAQQVEQKLQMLDGILGSAPVEIFLCDRNGKYLYASPAAARLLGLSQTDLIGKTWQQLGFPPQAIETIDAQREKVLTTKLPITAEFSLSVADEIKTFEYTISPMGDPGNTFEAVVITLKDITKHKQAEAEINKALTQQKELNELKSRFISIISHELRNPLHRIFLGADLLRNYIDKWTEEQKNQQLQYILSAAKQTQQIMADMLLVSEAETGKLMFKPGLLDLKQFCHQIVEEMQAGVNKNHSITLTIQGHTSACLDEKLLRPILRNLLSNAIKYSPEDSNIQFDLICESGNAIFQIQDSGIGIPLKERSQLFTSFHRGSNVGKIEGIGLGLSIVKQCVDLHGGEITIESEQGVGTKVIVTLPLNYLAARK